MADGLLSRGQILPAPIVLSFVSSLSFLNSEIFDTRSAMPRFSAISSTSPRINPHRFSACENVPPSPAPLYQIREGPARLASNPLGPQHGRSPNDSCCTRLVDTAAHRRPVRRAPVAVMCPRRWPRSRRDFATVSASNVTRPAPHATGASS